jgi:REP element-mobilizing transposase RayT
MTLYKDKYRIESVRLQGYDYSQPGAYFITIVTHNRQCLFGNIVDGEMMLNEFGVLVKNEWLKTGIIRPNIVIDAFVVMPNHLHGILIITGNDDGRGFRGGGDGRDTLQRVSTTKSEMESDTKSEMESDTKSDMESDTKSNMESDTGMGTKTIEQFGKPTKNSIPTIVRLFKSTTTKQINQLRRDTLQGVSTPMQRVSTSPMQPLWQRNYYEHIIRNEIELNRIRQYIIDNPKKWKTDKNYI